MKDDLKDKVSKSDLDKSTLELKLYMRELFEKVPTEDRIKTIFSEQLKSHGVATETYVKAQINESNATLMKWIVGIGISAIVSIGLALIRFFTIKTKVRHASDFRFFNILYSTYLQPPEA